MKNSCYRTSLLTCSVKPIYGHQAVVKESASLLQGQPRSETMWRWHHQPGSTWLGARGQHTVNFFHLVGISVAVN